MSQKNSDQSPSSKSDILHTDYKSKGSSFKKFIDFIEKIRKTFSTFAESIEQIFGKNFSFKENQPATLLPLLTNLENHIKFQAKEFKKLSKSIYKEIIDSFKILSDSNKKLEEKLNKELNESNKVLKKSKIKLEENQTIYHSKMKNLEKLILEEKSMKINTLSGNNDIKEKRKQINDLISECKVEENKYEKIIEEVNNNVDNVKEKENMRIGFYKSCEQNRINKIKENVIILVNSIKGANNKINNDIDNLLNQISNLDIQKDIMEYEKFIKINYKSENHAEFKPYKPMAQLDDSLKITEKKAETEDISIKFEIISTLQKNFKNISNNVDINEEKRRNELRKLCLRLFDKDQNINFVKEDLDNLLSFIENHNYRQYFLSYLTKERTNGQLVRSEKLINDLGIILKHILFLAEKECNYNDAKNCIILSETFYSEEKIFKDDDTYEIKKIYLLTYFKDNVWIHNIKFWQEIIDYDIITDKLKFVGEHHNLDQAKIEGGLKNVYFSKILTHTHNMCIFNIDKNETIKLCQDLVEKYKLGDDLKKMIFNSIEDVYNPNKKIEEEKKVEKKTNVKSSNAKEKPKKTKQKAIEDEWVIYNESSNKKSNKPKNKSSTVQINNDNNIKTHNDDIIIDDFVVQGYENFNPKNDNIININNNNKNNNNKNINNKEDNEDIFKNEIKDEEEENSDNINNKNKDNNE